MLLRMTLLSVTEQAFVVLIFSKQSQNCYSGFETTRNLHWKSLQHRLLGWIRIREVSTGNLRVSLRHTIRQANIVVREKFHQSHIDLISGKKRPGHACLSYPKAMLSSLAETSWARAWSPAACALTRFTSCWRRSNLLELCWGSRSAFTAKDSALIVTPAGIRWLFERMKGFITRRMNLARH